MNPLVSALMFASGSVLASRLCHLSRLTGAALIASGLVLTASPALADETILVADNGEVRCQASKSDLTRISLKDDQFVSVSRVQSGIESEDFSIVHEPTRGDIYISVPQGYAKPNISFFGTTQNGFVYKFDCQVAVEAAVQVQMRMEAFQIGADHELVGLLLGTYADVTGRELPTGVKPFGDDGNRLAHAAGIPVLTHGPVATGAHTVEERAPLDELLRVAQVYALMALRFC